MLEARAQFVKQKIKHFGEKYRNTLNLNLTSQCLAVTGCGSVGECGRWSGF